MIAAVGAWLDGYGWLGRIGAGFGGALAAALILLAVALARWWWTKASVTRILASEPKTINPMEDTFRRQQINIMDFHSPFNRSHEGKTFIECEIRGPAVVVFFGQFSMDGTEHYGSDFVMFDLDAPINNAVLFKDATFRRCTFYKLTILIPDAVAEEVDRAMGRVPWLNKPDRGSL